MIFGFYSWWWLFIIFCFPAAAFPNHPDGIPDAGLETHKYYIIICIAIDAPHWYMAWDALYIYKELIDVDSAALSRKAQLVRQHKHLGCCSRWRWRLFPNTWGFSCCKKRGSQTFIHWRIYRILTRVIYRILIGAMSEAYLANCQRAVWRTQLRRVSVPPFRDALNKRSKNHETRNVKPDKLISRCWYLGQTSFVSDRLADWLTANITEESMTYV